MGLEFSDLSEDLFPLFGVFFLSGVGFLEAASSACL